MSFLRHPEIYRPMWGSPWRSLGATTAAAPTHRLDEFPAGYSLAGCAPAEPASASPAGHQYAVQSSCRSRIFQRTANSVLTVCVSPGGKRTLRRRVYRTARPPKAQAICMIDHCIGTGGLHSAEASGGSVYNNEHGLKGCSAPEVSNFFSSASAEHLFRKTARAL